MTIHGPTPIVQPLNQPAVERAAPPTRKPNNTDVRAAQQPASPPAGVNAELWSVLTSEEREFFLQDQELGAITYGPKRTAPVRSDAPRGQRIDVRA